MKIFIAGKGKSLNEMVDDRFARCGYFVTYDTEKKDIVSFEENPYKEGTGGVGVKVANYIINNGFEAAIGPEPGPNSANILKEAGIKVYVFHGHIQDAVESFLKENEK
ncbi:dinitrogenase iron-molybdenum cofactor biosynthesis protein [candidate division TA06 bacterium]|uniref:Dinitrogenase iron-molybdenum cofactor biosynthesis protein n=1 Tax=candidate division TA06 bacterium TaxID=2250710 RepID=A0A660S5M5_UNCT6|nr:MAG: dinitrogenase iron-molybdenum cofactor biosynthesis protein [candidate division TA06 bacterium]